MVRPSTATFFSSTPLLSLSLALLQATGSTARASHIGRGCSGEHVAKLNPLMFATDATSSGEMSKRQDSSSMSSTPGYNPMEMDPTVQCTGYSYAPVLDNKAKFPTIWQTAQLVPGDQVAADLYAKALADVQSMTPNVQVKGTLGGDFSSFTPTYNTSDPDCWWTYRQCDTPKDSKIPKDIINIPEPLSYGIGFDDGPNCSHNAFYQHLSDANVKATMYYIGSNVMNWPYQAQRGLKDGHELAVHTWSHQYLTAMTNEQVFAELYYTQQAIKLVTGVSPLMFRPPFGDIDNRVRVIAASLNMTSVLWETDSDDWRIGTGTPPVTSEKIDANYQSVVDAAKNGSYNTRGTIMLTHELNNFTMSEAIKFLPALQGAFKALVPVAQGLNVTHPYLENNVTFPDFAGQTGSSSNTESASNTASASSTDSASSSAATGSTTAKATGNDVSAANANSASVSGTVTASAAAETSNKSNGAMRGMKSLDLVGSMVVAVGIALGSLA